MALVVKVIPGLYGGVSNQSESLRKDNQVTEMVNCTPGLVSGTTRRPNVIDEVSNTVATTTSFIYDYSRSTEESNILTVETDGTVGAQTLTVGTKLVTYEAGNEATIKAYLAHEDPRDLSGITIGDTTYLCNSQREIGIGEAYADTMSSTLDEIYTGPLSEMEKDPERFAYYWFSRSSNDPDHPYNYVVELNDIKYEVSTDKSEDAARAMASKIAYEEQVCNIESTPITGQGNTFSVIIKTGITVGSGTLIDIDGFAWTSIDGQIDTEGTTGALSWVRNSLGNYTVTIRTANVENPISYLMNIGEQEFLVVTETTTTSAADNLSNQLNNFIGTLVTPTVNTNGFTAEAKGSIIKINKRDLTDFTFDYWDSWGSQASYGWKYDVSVLQDLPTSFPWDGAIARINSKDGSGATNYFVKRWHGTWQEYTNRDSYANNRRTFPLLNNMPVIVERLPSGNFFARVLSTEDQLRPPLVGNDINNKDPYFVGKKIKQLFYINGRICIVSGDALTFSETDVLWNFYATTIIDILASDTIEVKIASEKVIEILSVAIFQSGLLIMTSEGQYLYDTEEGITPFNVAINKLSNYSYNDKGGTVYDGDSIVFSGSTGDTARIYRYRVARLTSENKALDLTIQVPTYIQGTVEQITNFVEDGTLVLRTTNSKGVYLYKEVISGDQMVQSSWYRWDFSNILTDPILHIMVIDSYLYFVSSGKVYKISLGSNVFDTGFIHRDLEVSWAPLVVELGVLTESRDALTLELAALVDPVLIDAKQFELDAKQLEVDTKQAEIDVYNYASYTELTKWRVKKTQSGVQTPRGRLQIRNITMALEGEANLKVYREDRDHTTLKPIRHNRGVNILSDTDKTILSIENNGDSPFTLSGMAMSGTYREKGKEIK